MKVIETHIVPALGESIRLQEYGPFIFEAITTKSGIKKAIKRQEILIDGGVATTSQWIKAGQIIELLQQETSIKKIFELKLQVIFEDSFMAVIQKPAGYPTSGNFFKTIENALEYNLNISKEKDALPRPLPVHRLDAPTSGLLIIAKTRSAQTSLNRAFQNKEIIKTYHALVHGETPALAVYKNPIEGKISISNIKTLRHVMMEGTPYSLVKVIPETGRTHQIRIHLSSNGFPIVGDKEYGKEDNPFKKKGLYLTATGLQLTHPTFLKGLSLNLEIPKKFVQLTKL